MKAAVVVIGCALLSGCAVSTDSADSFVRSQPVHDVKIGWPAPGVCDWNQKTGRHYTAIDDKTGKPVSGVICTNLFEDVSIAHPDRQ